MNELRKLISYKDLFWQLTFREIKARYKQSILGYAWAILVPLLNLFVLSVVFSHVFRVPTGNTPYPIFLFVGLVPWLFLTNAITAATGSILANASLVTKVSLPREILPLSAISSKMIDLFLASLTLVIFLIVYNIGFHLSLLFLPLIFLIQLFLILGVALILSATNVFFRDIENILGVFLTVWMYLTPIIYPSSLIPDQFKLLFYLNPMVGIIDSFREIILNGQFFITANFIYSSIFSVSILILGIIYFRKKSKFFADVI